MGISLEMTIRRKISFLIFIVAIFGTLSIGTQTFAKNVKYHKSLGRYLFLYKNKNLKKKYQEQWMMHIQIWG